MVSKRLIPNIIKVQLPSRDKGWYQLGGPIGKKKLKLPNIAFETMRAYELGNTRWCPSWLLILIKNMYLNGMWLGMAPRTHTKKIHVQKKPNYVIRIW